MGGALLIVAGLNGGAAGHLRALAGVDLLGRVIDIGDTDLRALHLIAEHWVLLGIRLG